LSVIIIVVIATCHYYICYIYMYFRFFVPAYFFRVTSG